MNIQKFAAKKWYIIDSERKGGYSHENPIKFFTSSIESSLCDYSDACILVIGNITVTRTSAAADTRAQPQRKEVLNAATQVASNDCTPFKKCRTEINETFFDEADFVNITMLIYNLIKYTD